jgi:importin-5
LVPLLKFYFHEEVRRAAVAGILMPHYSLFSMQLVRSFYKFLHLYAAMPELLRSAKLAVEKGQSQGRDESYVKQLSDYIIPALVEALHKVSGKASVV